LPITNEVLLCEVEVKRAGRILSRKTTDWLLRFSCVAGSLRYTSIPRSPTPCR